MEATDAAAIAKVLSGDPGAFQILVERHSRSVFRLAFRLTHHEQDAEDVVQEAFLRAYRQLGQFESRASFNTWLYRITVNCALDWNRKRRRHEDHREPDAIEEHKELRQLEDPRPSPERLTFGVEVQQRLQAALKELSDKERTAFLLRHFEEMSIEEISQILGMREGATKNSIFRAAQKVRREFQPVMSARP